MFLFYKQKSPCTNMEKITDNLRISQEQLNVELKKQQPLLLFDLRTKEEFEKSHITGSVHAVCDSRAKERIMPNIPKRTKIVLISESDEHADKTAKMMVSFGLDACYLSGGFASWKGCTSNGTTGRTISPESLLKNIEQIYILDVRDVHEFNEYQIPGSVNIPLSQLFDQKQLEKIPRDLPIVTVCPRGNRAMVASFALAKAGIESKTLEGGLAGWNQVLIPVTVTQEPRIIQIQKIGKGCLSHIVESDGDAVVIDPLYPFEKYIDMAKESNFTISKVIDTHQHADHVSAARSLAKATNASLCLSGYETYDYDAEFLKDGSRINFGKSELRVMHTPGHTLGSLSFVVDEKYVFTGDILFVESIRRPDLRDNAEDFAEQLYNTLHKKLLTLPEKIMVFPTHHGEKAESVNDAFYSTIKESKNLPWLNIPKQEFFKKVVSMTTPRPLNYQKIIAVNKGEVELIPSDIPDLEIGPNRCAVNST